MKVLIADDEQPITDKLEDLCMRQWPDAEIVKVHTITDTLLECADSDIVFLDMEMDASGASCGPALRNANPRAVIIVVSGYPSYKSDAYHFHPFDYIEKPFTDEDVLKVMQEAMTFLHPAQEEPAITLKAGATSYRLHPEDIVFAERYGRKIHIHMTSGDPISFYGRIGEVYTTLAPYGFLMPHQAYVVNARLIRSYRRYSVLMADGTELAIAQGRFKTFETELHSYLMEE